MEWKKGTLQSFLKLNKEKLIFVFCSGLLLFVLALPSESDSLSANQKDVSVGGEYWGTGIAAEQSAGSSGIYAAAMTDSYESALEMRVRNILSGVEGVGEVEVMVALKPEDADSMFQEEQTQEVLGIIISADGGGSAVVKAEISEAMEALFGLPSHKIKVLKRVKKGV